MSQFDRDFTELLRLDAARRGVKPAQPVTPAPEPDDDLDIDDFASIDADIMRASRKYRRGRDPAELSPKHILLARRLAAGEAPFAAARVAPLNYSRRAVRSLVNTPAWQLVYQQLRHERSPTIAELIEATRTRDPGVAPSVPFAGKPGYAIKLASHQSVTK